MWALHDLIQTVLQIYLLVIFAGVILSWLIAFEVVNMRNGFVRAVYEVCNSLTEPALGPIRRILPSMGTIDLSPMVLILLIIFGQGFLAEYWHHIAGPRRL